VIVLGVAALMAGCGGSTQVAVRTPGGPGATGAAPTTPDDLGRYKVGAPYQINGAWYYPKVDYDYDETGIASWYGPNFHGKTTANGERFNQNAMTAAHKTLPMPSMVRVTNLDNGRQIKVRINDRGPYSRGRIIDLSKRSAELLGFRKAGTAKVRVTVVEDESRRLAALAQGVSAASGDVPAAAPTTGVQQTRLDGGNGTGSDPARNGTAAPRDVASVPQPSGRVTYVNVEGNAEIFIQAGAFLRYGNARRLSGELAGLAPTRIETANVDERKFYRVRLGPMPSVQDADDLLGRLTDRGHGQAQVVID
jgi:rare lipoprotein A